MEQNETLKEKTARGLFWGGMNNGVQQLIGLAVGIVLGRLLSPHDYGMIAMITIRLQLGVLVQHRRGCRHLCRAVLLGTADSRLLSHPRAGAAVPLFVPGLRVLKLRAGAVGLSLQEPAHQATGQERHHGHHSVEHRGHHHGVAGLCLLVDSHADQRIYPHLHADVLALLPVEAVAEMECRASDAYVPVQLQDYGNGNTNPGEQQHTEHTPRPLLFATRCRQLQSGLPVELQSL